MKKSDSEDFSVLYIEPGDELSYLFSLIAEQSSKPVVLLLADQASIFQRPADYATLKHVKRQHNLTVVFVIGREDQRAQLATRSGFSVYPSMESLMQAVSTGQIVRQRTMSRTTLPLFPPSRQAREGKQRINDPVTPVPPGMMDVFPLDQQRTSMPLFAAGQEQYVQDSHQSAPFSLSSQKSAEHPLPHNQMNAFGREHSGFYNESQEEHPQVHYPTEALEQERADLFKGSHQSSAPSQPEMQQEYPQAHHPTAPYPPFFSERRKMEYPHTPDPATPYPPSPYLFQNESQARNNPPHQADQVRLEKHPTTKNLFSPHPPEVDEEDLMEPYSDPTGEEDFLIAGPPSFALPSQGPTISPVRQEQRAHASPQEPTVPLVQQEQRAHASLQRPAIPPVQQEQRTQATPLSASFYHMRPDEQLQQDEHIAQPSKTAPDTAPQTDYPAPFPQAFAALMPRRFPWLLALISFLLIVLVVGSSLLVPHFLQSSQNSAAVPQSVGSIVFASSGHVNEDTNQGISDQIEVILTNLAAPAPQTAYYAWLLSDKTQPDPTALSLGVLKLNQGKAQLFYAGDAQHTNLLEKYSQFLVTQESASVPPISPTPDQNAWRYYGAFSTTPTSGPDNPKHFSYLDHLRHLLASDPTLDELQLPGGLNNWFFDNTEKVFEWSSSMRGSWEGTRDAEFTRRMAARILEYLDGTTYVYLDLPKGSPLLVNERLARVGLLTVAGPDQQPPSYLQHIDSHLSGLLATGNETPALSKQITSLTSTLNSIQKWLTQVRTDAQKLESESDTQLTQPATLDTINDMIVNSNNAYAGSIDPATGTTQPGVLWLHSHIQALASMNITAFSSTMASQVPPFKAAQA